MDPLLRKSTKSLNGGGAKPFKNLLCLTLAKYVNQWLTVATQVIFTNFLKPAANTTQLVVKRSNKRYNTM